MSILKNIFTATFFTFFCAALFFVSRSATSQNQAFRVKSHPNFNLEFSGVVKVIDGDSIKVGKKEVRLVGIDAPEYSQTCFDAKNNEYECGKESFDFLLKLAQKKNAKCLYAELDKYNRFLAKCFIDGVSINDEILRNGMAVIYSFDQTDKKSEKLELEAKEKKLGIWRGAFQLPKDYRKSHPRIK